MKKNLTEREEMLKYINSQSSKYDCLFLKITNYYGVRDMSKVTDEQLRECCEGLKQIGGRAGEEEETQRE